MIERVRESFAKGISRLKWFSEVFAERLKIEISVIRLLYRTDELAKKREELLRSIGERVYELKGSPDRNILRDTAVVEAVGGIEQLEKEMEELKRKASEMSSVRA